MKKREWMRKKTAPALLLLVLGVILGGCQSKGAESEAVKQVKDYVYKVQEIEVPELEDGYTASQLLQAGGKNYAYGYAWSEDGESYQICFYELLEDGSVGQQYSFRPEENYSYNDLTGAGDGNLYCIVNHFGPSEENPEEYIDEYYFTKITMEGEKLFMIDLDDIPEIKKLHEEEGYLSVYNMILLQDKICMNCMERFCIFDEEGNFISILQGEDGNTELQQASLYPTESGKVVAVCYGESGIELAEVDMQSGSLKEKYELPGVDYGYAFYQGMGYDLYLTDDYGLYGYNLGDAEKTQIFNYLDSDFGSNLSNVIPLSEKEFLAAYYDMESGRDWIGKFMKVDPSEVKEKEVITLAMGYSDWSIRMRVLAFNKENEKYRISLQDYSALYATSEDYSAGVSRLNTDIASGNVPDIILIDNSMPADSYASKGLLEDLFPYIERDSELADEELMPNIVEAFSKDGKMYVLVPHFAIQTMVAKTSVVGGERGWTIQEALDIWEAQPEGTEFLAGMDRDSVFRSFVEMLSSEFIDTETGKCNYNSQEFVQLLEFVNRFPETLADDYYSDDYWMSYDSMWRDGRVLAATQYIGNYSSYNRTEKGNFGEKITMIGYPSESGDGTVIQPTLQLAISSKSKNKEGAWEFLRYFLLDEYQKEGYGFPITVSHLERMQKEATESPYYLDENGNKVEVEDFWYIGDEEIVIDPMTEEEAEAFTQQLYELKNVANFDEALFQIIEEEAAAYFAGQKTAQEVSEIIQSRAQIYVNENR